MTADLTLATVARRLDLAGDLDGAREQIQSHLRLGGRTAAQRVDAFRVQARILRHRDDPGSLRTACDAAAHAVRLATLPALAREPRVRALAELELAACLAASDRHDEAATIARRWLNDADPAVSGWAWTLLGETHTESGRFFTAVAALQNAQAEFARGDAQLRERSARILLGEALTRSGRLADAAATFDRDLDYWSQASAPARIRVKYLVARAATLHQLGRIAEALTTLRTAERLLKTCTGMDGAWIRLQHQFADCLTEWGQFTQAETRLDQARATLSRIARSAPAGGYPPPPPPPRLAAPLQAEPQPGLAGVHQDLVRDEARLAARLARRHGSRASIGNRRQAVGLLDQVSQSIDFAKESGSAGTRAVTPHLVSQVARLQGVPGAERAEASALVDAAALLRGVGGPDSLLQSERLLRRALARLDLLDGMGICQARAMLELGLTLASTTRRNEALWWVLRGVERLDGQRFAMRKRDYRAAWLRNEIHPAFEVGIALALEQGRADIASDLIVFSRTAGFVAAEVPGSDGEHADLPLLRVPRAVGLDGHPSEGKD